MTMNLQGILVRVYAFGIFMFVLALILLIWGGKASRKISIAQMVFCVFYIGYYLWVYANPLIASCEGRFLGESWERSVAPHTKAYVFDTEEPKHQRYYLDLFTRKDVIPFELQKGAAYRIYYEERTNIIVALEAAGG